MTNVLVTHADEPIGRRVVKTLFHDPSVATILATGDERAIRRERQAAHQTLVPRKRLPLLDHIDAGILLPLHRCRRNAEGYRES